MRLGIRRLSDVHTNIALLVTAFAAGQGAMFVGQTCLIAGGKAAFLGTVGTAYYAAVLVYLVIDWGGALRLARTVAGARKESAGAALSSVYWSLVLVRVALTILVVAAITVASSHVGWSFEAAFAVTASLGLAAHAFNVSGILDGLGRSGVAGLLAAIPIFLFAGTLAPAASLTPVAAGCLLGSSYSVGVLLTTALQLVAIRRCGIRLQIVRLSANVIRESFFSGATYLIATLPGQLFFRGQLWISHSILGPSVTGMVVYAKQFLNASNQLLQFVRRAEFPRLVTDIARGIDVRTAAYTAQKTGLVLSFVGCAGLLILAAALPLLVVDSRSAAYLLAAFAPLTVTGGVYLGLQQAYAATDRISQTIPVTLGYVIGGLSTTYALIDRLNAYAFPIVEGVAQLFAIGALLALMRTPNTPQNNSPSHSLRLLGRRPQ